MPHDPKRLPDDDRFACFIRLNRFVATGFAAVSARTADIAAFVIGSAIVTVVTAAVVAFGLLLYRLAE